MKKTKDFDVSIGKGKDIITGLVQADSYAEATTIAAKRYADHFDNMPGVLQINVEEVTKEWEVTVYQKQGDNPMLVIGSREFFNNFQEAYDIYAIKCELFGMENVHLR